ncbi:unnamed protein product [Linum tenue]|uniref:TF-B3 domain-containing protein n=1 Tax=Linum tenue TaxID=586396 RepID=A0AAV0M1L6_9ROSI|nr:unnamed protein product [Linum tenue]
MRKQSTLLLKSDDFAGVIPQRKWTRFDYLLAVAKFALKKLRQEEEQRNFHLRRRLSHLPPLPPTGRRKFGSFRSIAAEPKKKIEMGKMGKKKKNKKRGRKGRKTQEEAFGGMGFCPPLPERFARYIDEVRGREVKMVIQKRLSRSDLDHSQSRLSIPRRAVEEEFLTAEEAAAMGKRWGTHGCRLSGVDARLIVEPGEKEWVVHLKQWGTVSGMGNYVLTSRWNSVVEEVKFEEDDAIQLWSFRVGDEGGGELNLVLVRLGM